MKRIWIKLFNRYAVNTFVEQCTRYDADFEIASGEHTANGKSLLGLMTLNLSAPLELRIREGQDDLADFFKQIEPYCI